MSGLLCKIDLYSAHVTKQHPMFADVRRTWGCFFLTQCTLVSICCIRPWRYRVSVNGWQPKNVFPMNCKFTYSSRFQSFCLKYWMASDFSLVRIWASVPPLASHTRTAVFHEALSVCNVSSYFKQVTRAIWDTAKKSSLYAMVLVSVSTTNIHGDMDVLQRLHCF